MFDILETDVMNPNKIKVIKGIAGSGKSWQTDAELVSRFGSYGRYTSTNALNDDAKNKFINADCRTIASALFDNKETFYAEEKPAPEKVIVLDEVLQASSKIFWWMAHNVGKYNIFVTTDEKQMLAVGGEKSLKYFENLQNSDVSTVTDLTYSYRPLDDDTRNIFNSLYKLDSNTRDGKEILKDIPEIGSIEEYTAGDMVICHNNEIEERIYKKLDLSNRYDLPLVGKGYLASRKSKRRAPILCQKQADATKSCAYYQIAKIGTPTRLQGQEQDGRIIYVIEDYSNFYNREIYTAITRARRFEDIRLLVLPHSEKIVFSTFCGKPVYTEKTEEDKKKDEQAKEEREKKNDAYGTGVKGGKRRLTPWGDCKKYPALNLEQTPAMYKELEKHGLDRVIYPMYKNVTKKEDYKVTLDIFSCYPTFLAFGKVPMNGELYTEYDKTKQNYYIYTGKDLFHTGALMTDELAEQIPDDEKEYAFSTDYIQGRYTHIYDLATKDKESKQYTKQYEWGWYQKRYLERYNDGYLLNKYNTHELILVALVSQMTALMLKLAKSENFDCYVMVDAIHFNPKKGNIADDLTEQIKEKKDIIEHTYDYVKYRISTYDEIIAYNNTEHEFPENIDEISKILQSMGGETIIYKNYDELKKRSHHKK